MTSPNGDASPPHRTGREAGEKLACPLPALLGKAAELAGMSRVEFLETCGRYRVSVFNYPDEEAIEEIKKDLETLKQLDSSR
jgi:hypothetical protein